MIELLTRAQFPSALSPTDYDDSSIALQPASSVQFECDAGKTLDEPRNIVDVFLFGGGEVDTLEVVFGLPRVTYLRRSAIPV